jgi:dTDP-D-glucose 4,6-dehydratase
VVRIFNTYGPRMHPNDGRVVSNFVVQALKGEDITIYGDGSQTRAFCYVDDLVEAMLRMMATAPEITGPVNIGNPGEFSIRELAALVIELTGTKSKLVSKPLPQDDPKQRRPDISLAKKVLGWEPKIELRQVWRRRSSISTLSSRRREASRRRSRGVAGRSAHRDEGLRPVGLAAALAHRTCRRHGAEALKQLGDLFRG